MNEIQIFNNTEFGEIRTVVIDGEPWFVGRDIALKLGYQKPQNAIRDIVDEGDARKQGIPDKNNHIQKMVVINEAGLYSLIFGSKLPNAKVFKRWVTSEVLPTIRKTGSYNAPQLPQTPMELLELHYEAIKQVNRKVDGVSAEVDSVRMELDSLKMDLPILSIEADRITESVKKKGVNVLGGKLSNAYNDAGLRQRVYSDIYSNLKHNFGVRSYKSIKRCQCDKAVSVIENYTPPIFLEELIFDTNAQHTLL